MGSSIPPVIDYLTTLATTATQQASEPDWIVADGWPASLGERMFGVGSDRPPEGGQGSEVEGSVQWKGLGGYTVEEDYDVPCWVYSGAGGTDTAACRRSAFALWDLWFPLFRADLTFGGLLVLPASITAFRAETTKSPEEAKTGRYCLILFNVSIQNRY